MPFFPPGKGKGGQAMKLWEHPVEHSSARLRSGSRRFRNKGVAAIISVRVQLL